MSNPRPTSRRRTLRRPKQRARARQSKKLPPSNKGLRCEAFEIVPCIQSLDSFSERLASFPFVIWYRSSSTLKSRPATTFLPAAALIEIDEQFSLPALDG